jgi:hypothetical protein
MASSASVSFTDSNRTVIIDMRIRHPSLYDRRLA